MDFTAPFLVDLLFLFLFLFLRSRLVLRAAGATQ